MIDVLIADFWIAGTASLLECDAVRAHGRSTQTAVTLSADYEWLASSVPVVFQASLLTP